MEASNDMLRDKLMALSWNDLKNEAKKHSVKVKGKKAEILEAILQKLGNIEVGADESECSTNYLSACEEQSEAADESETSSQKTSSPTRIADARRSTPRSAAKNVSVSQAIAEAPNNVVSLENEEKFVEANDVAEIEGEVQMNVDDDEYLTENSIEIENGEKTLLDTTYTKDEDICNSESADVVSVDSVPASCASFLTEDNSPKPVRKSRGKNANISSQPMDTAVLESSPIQQEENCSEAVKSIEPEQVVDAPVVQQPISPKKVYNRFAKAHEKAFGLMPSIWDTEAKLKAKHAQNQVAFPEGIKHLISPKKKVQSPKKSVGGAERKSFVPREALKRNFGMPSLMEPVAKLKKVNGDADRKENASDKMEEMPHTDENAKFSPPADPNTLSFKFGDVEVTDIEKVQRQKLITPMSASSKYVSRLRSPKSVAETKRNVKMRTMNTAPREITQTPPRIVRLATTPQMTNRMEKLATPKGCTGNNDFDSTSSDASGSIGRTRRYTPYSGPFMYKDTTKMSDRELAMYNHSKGLHELKASLSK